MTWRNMVMRTVFPLARKTVRDFSVGWTGHRVSDLRNTGV